MEEEKLEETDVTGSKGTSIEEPMDDTGTEAPVTSNVTFMDFFDVWLEAYNATNGPYEIPSAVMGDLYDDEPVTTDDDNVHHEQCVNLRVLYEGDLFGLANAVNSLFPSNIGGQWDIHTSEPALAPVTNIHQYGLDGRNC